MSASIQKRLTDLPMRQRDAESLAEETLLAEVGSTPYLGRCREEGPLFIFDVEASYPRVIWDESGAEVRKTRFITIGKVGELVVDRNAGRVVDRPRYFDVQRAIRDKLEFVSRSVEKALVKIAADRFSLLPFPVHLHTPVLDVLSWLLVKDSMQLTELGDAPEETRQKLVATLSPLQRVGLIEIHDATVTAGPMLVGIEENYDTAPKQLEHAMAHFFREGFEFIDTVRQVLGTHLTVSSVLYEKAEEGGGSVPLSLDQIETEFQRFYSHEKLTKLPRYLVQLESIGVTRRSVKAGASLWSATPELFAQVSADQLLEPVSQLFR